MSAQISNTAAEWWCNLFDTDAAAAAADDDDFESEYAIADLTLF